ncbi:PAS domain S-box protein [Verrucomicrobiota bacterium sgz303538]
MNTAPRIGIQGLHTQLRVLFIPLAAVSSLFFAAVLDPLVAAGLGGVVFALLGWFFIRRVTWPLKEVAEAARQITRSEHAAQLPVPARGGDIAVLATAINGLLAARERQTRELLTSETQFLGTFENAAVGIAHVGLDCHWLRVNSRLCEITGYPREELLTKTFIDITYPDDLEADMANVRAMLAGEIPSYSLEKRYIRKDGSVIWVLLTVSLARDTTGEPAYFISVVEDISARKQTEEALRESEAQFRGTFDNAAVGIAHTGLNFRWLRVNDKLCEIIGYSRKELLKMTFVEITHPDDRKLDMALTQALVAGEIPTFTMEKRYIRKDCTLVWVNITVALARDAARLPAYFITVIEDISARKQAEAALRRSEDRFRIAAESMSDLVYDVDLRTGVIEWFGDFEASVDYKKGEFPRSLDEWENILHPDDHDRVMTGMRRVIAEGGIFSDEYRIVYKDGSIRYWIDRGSILRDSNGEVVRWVGAVTDITDRKLAAERLRKNEELLRMATELGRAHAFEWDLLTDSVLQSPGLEEALGLKAPLPRYTGQKHFSMVHPEDLARFQKTILGLTPAADTYAITYRMIRVDGRTVTFEEHARGFFNEQGQLVRLIGMSADITTRAAAEQALRESEENHRRILDNLFIFVGVLSPDGTLLSANRVPLEAAGTTLEETCGKKFWETSWWSYSPEIQAQLRESIVRCARGEALRYDTVIRADGRMIAIDFMLGPVRDSQGRITHLVPSAVDITDRKRAEEALREREERLRMAMAVGRIVTFEWDPLTDEVLRSENFGKILGLSDDGTQRTGQQFFTIVHPEDRARLKELLWGLTPSVNTYATTYRIIRPDGCVITFEERARGLFNEDGRLVRVIGMAADITERKRAEDVLRESEERLSTVVEHLTEGVIIADSHGTLMHWNPAALAMHGYVSMDECRHEISKFAEFFELRTMEDDRVLTLEEWPMPRILRGEMLNACEMRVRRPDQGWERILSYSGSQVRSVSGEILSVLSAVDITDRKRAEKEISAAKETAEAANRAKDDFLASLSHELRTPLNPVLMLASEMEQRDALSPALREDFALIHKYVALEARLIDDLLDVTRITRGKLQLDLRRVNAHEVLNQALAVVHADVLQKQIALSLELNATNSWVKADPVRLQQVFWNVLCNAVKFTPPGGRITVRSHNTPEQRVCVEITDTGIGMRPEELARMFTAFSQGEHAIQPGSQYRFGGLGLGLTICRQLVTMHGGQIYARSDGRGKGSVFTIELPLAPAEAVSSEEVPAGVSPQAAASAPKHLHILLVEDHEPTRITLSRLLRRRGHDVMCADSLAAGRKLVTNLATPQGEAGFDLLISDLGLPDGNGCELMAELRKRYKATIKGVALSGFGMEDDIRRSLASGFSTHLTKPVDIQSLENAMQMEQ